MIRGDDPRLVGIEQAHRYELSSPLDLESLPPVKYLIKGLIPEGSITGVTSYPGVGKTWFSLEMLRAQATGDKLLGLFEVLDPGSVLFVGSDASVYDYGQQWRKLSRGTIEGQPEHFVSARENIRFLLQSDFLFENLDTVRALVNTIRRHRYGPRIEEFDEEGESQGWSQRSGFKLVIFDTLSKLTRANQNDNTQMEEVFRNIRFVTEATGAAVIVLHHNSKRNEFNDGDDWRGAMSQIGALDGWLDLKKSRAKTSKGVIRVDVKKFRGITPEPFHYRMDVQDPDRARLIGVASVVESEQTAVDVTPKSVPELIRVTLKSGSQTSAQLQELAVAIFNDEPEDQVRARVMSALGTGKRTGELVHDRTSKHYMLAEKLARSGNDVDSQAQPGGAPAKGARRRQSPTGEHGDEDC
jgi:AAA domain-containing protein